MSTSDVTAKDAGRGKSARLTAAQKTEAINLAAEVD
jgi:hypothetical protein